ncbi:MAG: hypothetical protein OXU70_04210 [Gammaproteobacteria bacterium]|nr:hypothetical protein [Gammaproteobacteria bacterium]
MDAKQDHIAALRVTALLALTLIWVSPTQAERQFTAVEQDDSTFRDRMRQAKETVEIYYPRANDWQRAEISVQGNILNACRYDIYLNTGNSAVINQLNHERQVELMLVDGNSDSAREQRSEINRYFQKEIDKSLAENNERLKRWTDNRDACYKALEAYEAVIYSLKD